MDIDTRKTKYISKLKLSKNKVLAGLFQISGYSQLNKLLSDYNMPDICNNFKDCLLDIFGKNFYTCLVIYIHFLFFYLFLCLCKIVRYFQLCSIISYFALLLLLLLVLQ